MKLDLYVRKACDRKLAMVGILTSDTDLNAESFTKFKFAGQKVAKSRFAINFLLAGEELKDRHETNLENHCVNSLLKHELWCGFQANDSGFFGGVIGICRTQNFENETGVFRYMVFSAFDDTCDLLEDFEYGLYKSNDFSLYESDGSQNAGFDLDEMIDLGGLIENVKDPAAGNGVAYALLEPVWNHNGGKYRLNALLSLETYKKLSEYTLKIAKSDANNPPIPDEWIKINGFNHNNDQRYHHFLRYHYRHDSPLIFKSERLLTEVEHKEISRISKLAIADYF